MFKQYKEQLETVQTLFEAYVASDFNQVQTKELKNYLNGQDMAFVKLVQVILYVGSTKPHVEEGTKEALYDKVMDAFNQLKGWRTQEIEVNNMIIKVGMDRQFKEGMAVFETLK